MILGIDTAGFASQVVLFDDNRRPIDKITWRKRRSQSELALKNIEKLLENNSVDKSELKAIYLNQGPLVETGEEASFTGLKIGVTIANAIGFALKIPVVGVSLFSRSFVEEIFETKINVSKSFVVPVYPKEPNIKLN